MPLRGTLLDGDVVHFTHHEAGSSGRQGVRPRRQVLEAVDAFLVGGGRL
jgi:hypothetical protein